MAVTQIFMGTDMIENSQLQQLIDRMDLADLLTRYVQVIDFGETVEEILSVFTDDAAIEGTFRGKDQGRAALEAYARSILEMRKTVAYRHNITNVIVTIDGDSATITSFFILTYRYGYYGGEVQMTRQYMGDYWCRAVRINGRWLLAHRIVKVDPS